MTIYFYAQTDPFAEFSNFASYGVEMQGVYWRTVEHYFQAQKFDDAAHAEDIRGAHKPKDAKALGMTHRLPLRPDWEEIKADVMRDAVLRKFETHPAPRPLLLSTGDEDIVENARMDGFWGCGPDGQGLNWLGRLLMGTGATLRARP